jgi:hypothetical protein
MRPVAAAFACLATLLLPAAPGPTKAVLVSLGVAPVVELVTQGCSLGWHRGQWQDPPGEWHWGPCFPSWR